jgi:hypothetical protein
VYRNPNTDGEIYAYQLKKGKESVRGRRVNKGISKAFWIRGNAPESIRSIKKWYVATKSELETFFGVSGNYWTPTVWDELQEDEVKHTFMLSFNFY